MKFTDSAAYKANFSVHSTAGIAIAGAIFCVILSTFIYAVATIAADRLPSNEFKFAMASAGTTMTTVVLVAATHFGLLTL